MEWLSLIRQGMHDLVHVESLRIWFTNAGPWFFASVCAIIFCETGLVFMPFLPGDSLLFALGALAALVPGMNLYYLFGGLFVAAVAGDAVNYSIGAWVGPRVFAQEKSRWFNPLYLSKAKDFYTKHGAKTIVLARFVPVIRTFAPFVAGAGGMEYKQFALFNIAGAALWVSICAGAGFFFGNIPIIKENFELVIVGIVVVSVIPVAIEAMYSWTRAGKKAALETNAELIREDTIATPPAA